MDLIDRQAAIDALKSKKDKNAKGDIGGFYNKIIQNDIDALMQIPSAQHEIVRCKNCKHGMYDMMCKFYWCRGVAHSANWYCADAERITNDLQ